MYMAAVKDLFSVRVTVLGLPVCLSPVILLLRNGF